MTIDPSGVESVRVLGIDPGTAVTGYGVVGRAEGGAVSLVECGVVRTSARTPLPERIREMLLQGKQETFSSLYEQLTQEYYRRLAEEGSP